MPIATLRRSLINCSLFRPSTARVSRNYCPSIEERDPDSAAVRNEEIDRRAKELDSGRVAGVAAADVFAKVERRLRQWFLSSIRRRRMNSPPLPSTTKRRFLDSG